VAASPVGELYMVRNVSGRPSYALWSPSSGLTPTRVTGDRPSAEAWNGCPRARPTVVVCICSQATRHPLQQSTSTCRTGNNPLSKAVRTHPLPHGGGGLHRVVVRPSNTDIVRRVRPTNHKRPQTVPIPRGQGIAFRTSAKVEAGSGLWIDRMCGLERPPRTSPASAPAPEYPPPAFRRCECAIGGDQQVGFPCIWSQYADWGVACAAGGADGLASGPRWV